MRNRIKIFGMIAGFTCLMMSCSEEKESAKDETPVKAEMDMCSCFDKQREMNDALEAAGSDENLLKEIEEKYKADREACEQLGEKMQEEMKDLSEQEVMAKFMQMSEDCPAMKEAMGGL